MAVCAEPGDRFIQTHFTQRSKHTRLYSANEGIKHKKKNGSTQKDLQIV